MPNANPNPEEDVLPEEKSINLTVFLLRDTKREEFETAFLAPLRGDSVQLKAPLDGIFIAFPAHGNREPPWVPEVRSLLSRPLTANMNAMTPGGMLVIRHGDRTFVVTFGHAWQKLQDVWLEGNFGRRVAVNAIPRSALVEVRTEQVLAKGHLASERAPRASSADQFGVDLDRDLVGSLEGVPKQAPSLGITVRGGTSLKLTRPISQLSELFDVVLNRFASLDYQESWPELDNFTPVEEAETTTRLERQLDTDLANEQLRQRMTMFTPSQRAAEPILADSFIYGRRGPGAASTPYLTIDGWVNYLARQGKVPSVESAKSTPVHIYQEDHDVPHSVHVMNCLGYEFSENNIVYVLSSGTWYAVSRDYVRRVNQLLQRIPTSPLVFPAWNREHDEGEYNAECSAALGFLNCDARNLFYGGGHSQLEFCDMFDPQSSTLIFAKIVSRSTGMSHLTEQVRRTAQLLFEIDPAYRQKLRALFRRHYPNYDTAWLATRPQNESWNFCLLSLGRRSSELPFFAKCGLANLYRDMTVRGHKMFFAHV